MIKLIYLRNSRKPFKMQATATTNLLSFLAQYGTHLVPDLLGSDDLIIIRRDEPSVCQWLDILHLLQVILIHDVG